MPVFPFGSHEVLLSAANEDPSLQALIADPNRQLELASAITNIITQAQLTIPTPSTPNTIHWASLCILLNKECDGKTSRSLNAALSARRRA